VDSTELSNGKRKGTGNVKNGNPYLAWAYMEAAQFAMRFQPAAQRFYPDSTELRGSIHPC
jgi:transposase